MKTITYKFNDGTTSRVEVTDEFYALYVDIEKSDKRIERKETRRQQSLDKSLENGWDVVDANSDIVTTLEQKDDNERLEKALQQLTERQRTILTLFVIDNLSMREIGRELGLNKDTVREHYYSAIKKLKQILQ